MKIIIDCRGKIYAMNLLNSQKIHSPNGCEIFKHNEKFHNKGEKTTQMNVIPQSANQFFNSSIVEMNKKLSLLPLWNKYKLQLIESKIKIKRIKKSIPLRKENVDKIQTSTTFSNFLPNFDFGITNFFSNAINQFLFFAITIIVAMLVIKTMVIKLLTDWKI